MESSILTDILSRNPTETLYHYTNQVGFLGIIEGRDIWATHTQYLNDATEYRHAIDVATAEITRRLGDAVGENRRIFEDMAEGLNGIETINVCVCSFSADRDLLSQWRAYGGSMSGFAIGFNPRHLAEIVGREGFYLAPCLYEPTQQIAVIGALIDKVFEQNKARLRDGQTLISGHQGGWLLDEKFLSPQGGSLGAYMHSYAPILKDKSFSAEREWRIISKPLPCSREGFCFRRGNSTLIPFYRVRVSHSDLSLKLDEVVIGPTPYMELSRRAAISFLVSQRLEDVPVNRSVIPYRSL